MFRVHREVKRRKKQCEVDCDKNFEEDLKQAA